MASFCTHSGLGFLTFLAGVGVGCSGAAEAGGTMQDGPACGQKGTEGWVVGWGGDSAWMQSGVRVVAALALLRGDSATGGWGNDEVAGTQEE